MDATFNAGDSLFNYRVAGILIENNHVLIHKQVDDEHWALPGGRVKVLEDSQTSIVREIMEELGMTVNVDKLLWITENFFTMGKSKVHEVGLYYSLTRHDESVEYSTESFYGEEGKRLIYQWVPIDELKTLHLYPQFLRTSLQNLPEAPVHLIIRD